MDDADLEVLLEIIGKHGECMDALGQRIDAVRNRLARIERRIGLTSNLEQLAVEANQEAVTRARAAQPALKE